MKFSLDHFWRLNRRAIIWLVLLGLIYLLRDFFALMFITFLLVVFTLPVIDYFRSRTRIPRFIIISVLYLLILFGLTGISYYATPRIIAEANTAAGELAQVQANIRNIIEDLKVKQPTLAPLLDRFLEDEVAEYAEWARTEARDALLKSAKFLFKTISTVLLALLFGYLIVLDLSRLTQEVRALGRSRLAEFYREAGEPVVRFADVIAKAFRAQATIAVLNTVLTAIGLVLLGVPKILLLSIIVFFFSFIPVLGVILSTTPIVLVALNVGGLWLAVGVVVMITVVHIVEAYFLNPLIYGHHMKLNPVLVIIILFVGNHFFGIWGMVLGVPVATYFIYYVFGVPRTSGESGGDATESIGTPLVPPGG